MTPEPIAGPRDQGEPPPPQRWQEPGGRHASISGHQPPLSYGARGGRGSCAQAGEVLLWCACVPVRARLSVCSHLLGFRRITHVP